MLHRVASYDRTVGASLERAWENVRDWEHLPHLHRSSFRSIELLEQSRTGWRATVGLHPDTEIVLELVIDGDRYVSRTLEGPGAGSEIWTTLAPGPDDDATQVHVDFELAGLEGRSEPERAAIGRAYRTLYTRLWDEDEGMMRERAARLRTHAGQRIALGPRSALQLPLDIELEGRRVRLDEQAGKLVAQSRVCPHWLGPLEPDEDAGQLRCRWHGYAFDPQTGRNCDGKNLRMTAPPRVIAEGSAEEIFLVWD